MSSFTCPKCSRCKCECGVLPLTAQVTLTGLQPRTSTLVYVWDNRIQFFDSDGREYGGIEAFVTAPGGCYEAGFTFCPAGDPAHCDPEDDDSGPVAGVRLVDGGQCLALIARSEPSITLSAAPLGVLGDEGGSVPRTAAKFTPVFSIGYGEFGPRKDIPFWSISGVTIAGGSGYRGGEEIAISLSKRALPPEQRPPEDSRGSVEIEPAVLAVIADANGTPTGVAITRGGKYYKERFDQPGYTFPIVGKINRHVPSWMRQDDSGARIRAIVDDVATSETFGEVIDLHIEAGGEGILAYRHMPSQAHILAGQPLLMRATRTRRLVSFEAEACFGKGACVVMEAVNERSEPELRFDAQGMCLPNVNNLGLPTGCGGSFIPVTKVTYENDDPTKPVWSLESLDASGGRLYGGGWGSDTAYGQILYYDNITAMPLEYTPSTYCGLMGALPQFKCHVDPPPTAGTTANCFVSPPMPAVPASGGVLAGATVIEPGAFYRERTYMGEPVPVERVTLVQSGAGYAQLGRIAPTLSLVVNPNYGVTLVPTLGTGQDECGRDYWFIESIAVTGGAGYQSPPEVLIDAARGDTTGLAASVRLDIDEDGVPTVATVTSPGRYWRSSKDAQPYVATLTSRVIQLPPSDGEGAEISFEVDSDPYSQNFGGVKKVNIVNGGSGYIPLGQAGCDYESLCGVRLSLTRDVIALRGRVVGSSVWDAMYISMTAPGIAADGCEEGAVSLSATDGSNQIGANVIWPAPSGDICKVTPCYCRCPGDLSGLCITVTWTAPSGRTYTQSTNNRCDEGAVWYFRDTARHPVYGFESEVASGALTIVCHDGRLTMNAFGGFSDYWEGCYCSTSRGCTGKFCATGNWWNGSYNIQLEWEEWSPGSCSGCPNPGSFLVTISTPSTFTDEPC